MVYTSSWSRSGCADRGPQDDLRRGPTPSVAIGADGWWDSGAALRASTITLRCDGGTAVSRSLRRERRAVYSVIASSWSISRREVAADPPAVGTFYLRWNLLRDRRMPAVGSTFVPILIALLVARLSARRSTGVIAAALPGTAYDENGSFLFTNSTSRHR
jgi:hypothetical protein